jgi:phosphatidylinositol alpha 1,6-mannosyltransferase
MASERVRRIFEARERIEGDALFGHTPLLDSAHPHPHAPIPRVAVLAEAFPPKIDGVSKTAYFAVRYLQQTGREVLIFAPDSAMPSVEDSEVVALPSVSVPGADESRAALPVGLLSRRLAAFDPDLILMFSPAFMAISGMVVGRERNIPVIACYQTDLPGYAAAYGYPLLSYPVMRWLRYLHNGCHLTLVPTPKIGTELREQGYKRLRVWGRGVDIDLYHPAKRNAEMRARLLNGQPDSTLLCLYVGRLATEKCVHLLRQVASLPGVALAIVGDGALREELETQFAGTPTVFTGYLVGEELAQAFASADAFFFPGSQETFGQVVQEAMASGLPSVVTNRGGVSGLVDHGVNGFICEHTEDSFAEAAQWLRDDRVMQQRMAQAARHEVETRTWPAVMHLLESHMSEALELNARFRRCFGHTTYHHAARAVLP